MNVDLIKGKFLYIYIFEGKSAWRDYSITVCCYRRQEIKTLALWVRVERTPHAVHIWTPELVALHLSVYRRVCIKQFECKFLDLQMRVAWWNLCLLALQQTDDVRQTSFLLPLNRGKKKTTNMVADDNDTSGCIPNRIPLYKELHVLSASAHKVHSKWEVWKRRVPFMHSKRSKNWVFNFTPSMNAILVAEVV